MNSPRIDVICANSGQGSRDESEPFQCHQTFSCGSQRSSALVYLSPKKRWFETEIVKENEESNNEDAIKRERAIKGRGRELRDAESEKWNRL